MATWQHLFETEQQQEYYRQLLARVAAERELGKVIYPPESQVFAAFDACHLEQLKVVILGQDPYHGKGQAHGLSFSVAEGLKIPPSLRNIYKELAADITGFEIPQHGNLSAWANQGVLLLNTVLTVEQAKAHSHAKFGWETFTDAVIKQISQQCQGVVFLLWGAHAQKKGKVIDTSKHHVLSAVHPSPLSAHRGFLGCGHFSKTNQLLTQQNKQPINWQV
ncbi:MULTISPECIES: uracil-DNA glycosylase [unclassified Agarivorans]|uniref:uracil-DNA glycosylase n=1 Tax=unclassified Agarivorans TaxID=2636026 RepID=UPI0026E398B9|nr:MULTISPECIES: uracil-DNA glycosylase [unclassified Agarivorans]MDO6685782.1 uracil-DNA glycosylase [Agarivorans sp. 3_MG-2023]MDO6716103.1 uracil-DNA glycosylase [Agarivorans sp. 2_MG-2023]